MGFSPLVVTIRLSCCPGQSKSFGSKTANIEDWKPFKRLAGHTSDVCGLAWSEDDQYLASVGLDNLVLIWDCLDSSFLLLKRLDLHQGHVNGVAWDPVGQYLATQSDDRSVKIWRTRDWKLEADITQPFIKSPRSFFRRLSWSPDGAHIVTPNAMNGPVFVSAVIDRDKWTSDISLVGHENVVEVAAYNPLIFLKDKSLSIERCNLAAALALGARNSISIWLTSNSTPIAVLHDVFDRDILDLSWAADGVTLYACSSDGRVAAFVIEELLSFASVVPASVKADLFESYGYKKPDRRQQKSRSSSTPFGSRYDSPMPSATSYQNGRSSHLPSTSNAQSTDTLLNQQEMTIMPNGKRRIRPVFLGTNDSIMYLNSLANGHVSSDSNYHLDLHQTRHTTTHQPNHSAQPIASTSKLASYRHPSRKYLEDEAVPLNNSSHGLGDILHWNGDGNWGEPVPIPNQITQTAQDVEDEFRVDANNVRGDMDESIRYAEVILSSTNTNQELWRHKFLKRSQSITSVAISPPFVAVGLGDSTLLIFTLGGRRAMPMISLDSNCFKLQFRDHMLMAVSLKGTMMIWDLHTFKAIGGPIRLSDLNESRGSFSFSALTTRGMPVLKLSMGSLLTFDCELRSWIILSDHELDEMKEMKELDYRDLKCPTGSLCSVESALILCAKSEFLSSFIDHVRVLRDQNQVHDIDQLCHELWTGSGWMSSGDDHSSSSSGKLKINRSDRFRLLDRVIQILEPHEDFKSISQEYSILLKHSID